MMMMMLTVVMLLVVMVGCSPAQRPLREQPGIRCLDDPQTSPHYRTAVESRRLVFVFTRSS